MNSVGVVGEDGAMNSHWQYLALLLGCVAVTVPLEFVYGFRVWRAPKRLAKAIVPTVAVFTAWDVFAISRGHWTFSDKYTVGVDFPGGFPIEELLFFIVIPAAAISGFEAVRAGLARRRPRNG